MEFANSIFAIHAKDYEHKIRLSGTLRTIPVRRPFARNYEKVQARVYTNWYTSTDRNRSPRNSTDIAIPNFKSGAKLQNFGQPIAESQKTRHVDSIPFNGGDFIVDV